MEGKFLLVTMVGHYIRHHTMLNPNALVCSIAAAMCAIKSPEELLRDICVNTVSTDYLHTGEMKQKNIRWFPELLEMGKYWLKNGVLADSSEFKRCCDFYYQDITFEEAFEMTHKHVCITVTASRASAGSGVQRLLLNHISTPNVTLASAVAASCSCKFAIHTERLIIHHVLTSFLMLFSAWIYEACKTNDKGQ